MSLLPHRNYAKNTFPFSTKRFYKYKFIDMGHRCAGRHSRHSSGQSRPEHPPVLLLPSLDVSFFACLTLPSRNRPCPLSLVPINAWLNLTGSFVQNLCASRSSPSPFSSSSHRTCLFLLLLFASNKAFYIKILRNLFIEGRSWLPVSEQGDWGNVEFTTREEDRQSNTLLRGPVRKMRTENNTDDRKCTGDGGGG